MNNVIKIVIKLENSFDISKIDEPIENIGIDSLGFVALRVELEKKYQIDIPDHIWYDFKTISNIINFFEKIPFIKNREEKNQSEICLDKDYEVNLPKMANNALSENWFFKEMGNNHWDLLSKGLKEKSSKIKDETGERLYATFIRISFKCSSLRKFEENDLFKVSANITQYGKNNFLSHFKISSNNNIIESNFMTTFSKRDGDDNLDLLKSTPVASSIIPEINETPKFLTDYRLIKKRLIDSHHLYDYEFILIEDDIFRYDYSINPYYDLNGVGLLYFASYPTISDYCETYFFNELDKINHWADEYFTIVRDVFYFANCNIDDLIVFKINHYEFFNNKIKIYSSLFRKKDGIKMADLFTVKEKYASK